MDASVAILPNRVIDALVCIPTFSSMSTEVHLSRELITDDNKDHLSPVGKLVTARKASLTSTEVDLKGLVS